MQLWKNPAVKDNVFDIIVQEEKQMDESLLEKAMNLFKRKDYENAVEVFKAMLEQDPKNAHLFNNIGLCYAHLGQNEIAEEYYKKALFIDDKLAETYINIADIFYKENKLLEAIEVLVSGVGALPDNAALRHYLARIYIEDKRYDDAIDALDSVLELAPKNYDANWDLGMVYFELGDWAGAIANFEEVLQYVEDNELIFYQTALAYEANDELDKAISNYLKAIAVNDKFPLGYKRLGMLFMAREDRSDAVEYFEDYLKFDIPNEEKEPIKKILERLK